MISKIESPSSPPSIFPTFHPTAESYFNEECGYELCDKIIVNTVECGFDRN